MSGHTPGPWRVHRHEHISGELWLSIGNFTHDGTSAPEGRWIGPVAELKYLIASDEEQWSNARLIAAAPDLLVACKQAVLDVEERAASPLMQMLNAAIAKAEGQAQ